MKLTFAIHTAGMKLVQPTQRGWLIESVDQLGRNHVHAMPLDTFALRAAEYGIEPTDDGLNQAMDIVMHEPFIKDWTDPGNYENDPAYVAGLRTNPHPAQAKSWLPAEVPIHLHNAPDNETALKAHLLRIEHTKRNFKEFLPAHTFKASELRGLAAERGTTGDPLDVIREQHVWNHALMEQHAKSVEHTRMAYRGETPPRRVRDSHIFGELPRQPLDDAIVRRNLETYLNPVWPRR